VEDTELKSLLEKHMYYEYLQLPERLSERLGLQNISDYKGVLPRYRLIRSFIWERPLKKVVNIGGNCGFFSLSLLDEDLIEEAVIYDIKPDILELGRKIARAMGLEDRCSFVEKSIDLAALDELPSTDGVIYQNVLHHAGDYFDKDLVAEIGWEKYAERFLKKLRAKYAYGILGMGFKWNKPKLWDVDKEKRRFIFRNLLEKSGWEIISDANVYSLMIDGGELDYRRFNSQQDTYDFKKSDLASLWDLVSFNIIKRAGIFLGSRQTSMRDISPAVAQMGQEIAKMYHIYLME